MKLKYKTPVVYLEIAFFFIGRNHYHYHYYYYYFHYFFPFMLFSLLLLLLLLLLLILLLLLFVYLIFFEEVFFFFIPVFHSDCKCLLRSLVFSLLKLSKNNNNNNNSIILFQCLTIYCARNLEHNTGAFGDSVFTLMATLHCDSKDPTRVLAKKR